MQNKNLRITINAIRYLRNQRLREELEQEAILKMAAKLENKQLQK